MLKQCILIILFLCCTCVEKAGAQMVDGPYITWEDFVQSYLDPYQADNDTDVDLKERLEVLAQHPMQINLLGRDDLLQLPFITGEQADSLLSYRAKKHGFVSLGELQLIRGMDYYTRVYLSLFVRCEAAYPPTKEQLIKRMFNVLKGQAMYVREDITLTDVEKLEQADILLDLMKFLKDYDENVVVLNRYWQEKRQKEKFKQNDREM